MKVIAWVCSILVLGAIVVRAAPSPFSGTFKGKDGLIKIHETGPGKFAGEIIANGHSLPFHAQERAGALAGTLPLDDDNLEFRLTLQGSTLALLIEDESTFFTKQEAAPQAPGKISQTPAAASSPAPLHSPEKSESLRVNGVVIDEKNVQRFEKEHRLKLPRGDFWYDRVSGAWGLSGGPTLGFTAAGVNLGGPLQGDASRGNTGVFINRRELPPQDVAGLHQLNVPVQLGRWWVNSRGDFGREGNGAVLGNVFQFGQSTGGAYQRPTAGGYLGGDGRTSYFFDPKSGSSVMIGN